MIAETTTSTTTCTNTTHSVKRIRSIVFAHGCQMESSIDPNSELSSYCIVPENVPFVLPFKKAGFNMSQREVEEDFDILGTSEGRNLISGNCFDETPFKEGEAFPNIKLWFMCTFYEFGYSTGIITHKNLHKGLINIQKINNNDERLMNTLMEPHDDQIVPREQIWNKRFPLGEIIKMIANYGNCDGIFLNCCRHIGIDCEEKRPQFLTVKMIDSIYHSNFHTKINTLESYAIRREFPGISLRGFRKECNESKLKMRITITELISIIRIKLERCNAISSFEFHSIIEIYHTNEIPLECVIFSMGIKLKNILHSLEKVNENQIILNSDIVKPDRLEFRWRLIYICKYFNKNLSKSIIEYQAQAFDYVIATAERVIELFEISKGLYNSIWGWYDKLR